MTHTPDSVPDKTNPGDKPAATRPAMPSGTVRTRRMVRTHISQCIIYAFLCICIHSPSNLTLSATVFVFSFQPKSIPVTERARHAPSKTSSPPLQRPPPSLQSLLVSPRPTTSPSRFNSSSRHPLSSSRRLLNSLSSRLAPSPKRPRTSRTPARPRSRPKPRTSPSPRRIPRRSRLLSLLRPSLHLLISRFKLCRIM